jgi:hypothetical protein
MYKNKFDLTEVEISEDNGLCDEDIPDTVDEEYDEPDGDDKELE